MMEYVFVAICAKLLDAFVSLHLVLWYCRLELGSGFVGLCVLTFDENRNLIELFKTGGARPQFGLTFHVLACMLRLSF